MNSGHKSITEQARSILTPCFDKIGDYPTDHLTNTIDNTQNNINRKVLAYKWSGMVFLILIPIVSTVLSVSITKTISMPVTLLSYFLTLLTILNSIFKPRERFREACLLSINIEVFSDTFLAKLKKLANKEESEISEFCNKMAQEFLPYRRQLIDLFLPETAGEKKTQINDSL